jgi:hypothetical protein
MTWAIAAGGIVAVLIVLLLRAYLIVRTRQMTEAASRMAEFRDIAVQLLSGDLPEEARDHVKTMAEIVGSGVLSRKLLRVMLLGNLDTPVRRQGVEARRSIWSGYSRDVRVRFVQATFAGLLADSYYAGLRGTLLRRSLFFLKNSPAEIAEGVDAYETRVLIVGASEIGHAVADRQKKLHGNLVGV